MKEQLLELLQQNARLTNAELAVMLDTTEAEVADAIRALENDGVIKGYSAIVDDELANKDMVTAIIELRVTPQRDSGYEEIAHTVVNALAVVSGVVCDGAKASCAAKIAAAVDAGILGYWMYRDGNQFFGGDGIVSKGVENTIRNVGRLAREGMKETDKEIIKIMLE